MMTYPNQTAISTRELAWGIAGENVATEGRMTAEQAMRDGHLLDWNVRKVAVTTTGDTLADCGIVIPDRYATVRDTHDGPKFLGLVGSRYKVFQNEAMVDLLEVIVDEGGALWEAVGKFGNGERVFAVMKLPEGIEIAGQDAHDLYIVVTNSHDGTASLKVWVTAMRIACTNMLTPSLRSAVARWNLRHTASLQGRVSEARQSLELTWKWAKNFEQAAERMINAAMTNAEFDKLLDKIEPKSTSKHEGWVSRQDDRRTALRYLFREAETNAFGRGTRWAAYNAFTEYIDWYLPVKGGDDGDALARARRQMDSPVTENYKQRIWDALSV